MSKSTVQVHRFRGKIGVGPPEGPTFYLSAAAAHELGKALMDGAFDIESVAFVDSKFTPVTVNTEKV